MQDWRKLMIYGFGNFSQLEQTMTQIDAHEILLKRLADHISQIPNCCNMHL